MRQNVCTDLLQSTLWLQLFYLNWVEFEILSAQNLYTYVICVHVTLCMCANFHLVEQLLNTWPLWLLPLINWWCDSKTFCDLCFTSVVLYIKHQNLWTHYHKVGENYMMGQYCVWLTNCCSSLISLLIVTSVLQWIGFKVELTWALNISVEFIKHLHKRGRIKDEHKSRATLGISKAKHNKQIGWCSDVPCTKIAEELDNPIRKVTDNLLGWSVTGENVLWLLQIAQIQHAVSS